MPHTLSLKKDPFKWFLDCSGRKALPSAAVRRGQKIQRFKTDGIYGVKGGVFLNENGQLEGSLGYMNHFELRLNHRVSPFLDGRRRRVDCPHPKCQLHLHRGRR
jgi:hypothetical protein